MNGCLPGAGPKNQGLLDRDGVNLTALVGVALALGIYLAAGNAWISRDGIFYIEQARTLRQDPLGVAQTYPMGYPILLHVAYRVAAAFGAGDAAGAWVASSLAVTVLFRLLALIPLYLLSRMLVGPRNSFWALLILIVLPHPAQNGSDVLREWPFLLFLALGVWLLLLALRSRRWWLFGLIGLDAGLGYLIRPACAQVVLYGLVGLAVAALAQEQIRKTTAIGTAALLLLGFAVPAAPYVAWAGLPTHQKIAPAAINKAPVITSIAGRTAGYEPLRFEVSVGSLLAMPIVASNPDGDPLTFSVVAIPVGTRPMYRLRLTRVGGILWTISDREKNSLLTRHPPDVWAYEGIGGYAYAELNAAEGLLPVYRFWSPVQYRHFYTLSDSQRDKLVESEPESQWQSEGIAFHAFGADRRPTDAVAVYRFRNQSEERLWAVEGNEGMIREGIAWYAHAGSEPPTGLTVEDNVIRWRPGPDQRGSHQLNVIVDDGQLESCCVVRIEVGNATPSRAGGIDLGHRADPRAWLRMANLIFRSISDNLMQYFLVPLCLGLWYRLGREAGPYERTLIVTIVIVNIALMVGRYLCVQPVVARRYSLGLVALTIAYVPVGLDLISQRLAGLIKSRSQRTTSVQTLQRRWFGLLVAVGVAICAPKLLTRQDAKNSAYLAAVHWLRANTTTDDVIAASDRRIGFYAERTQVPGKRHVDPQDVDYVVIVDKPGAAPSAWVQTFSVPMERGKDRILTIHKRP